MDSTLRPTAVLMSGRLAGIVVAFSIPIVLARTLDQSAFGTYKQLFLIYATLYGIAQLGMAESLFYFLPADPAKAGRYTLNSLLVLAAAGAFCLVALWAGRDRVAAWFGNGDLAAGLPWIGLYLGLMLASTPLEIVQVARKRFARAAWTYAASDLARTALCLLPVLLSRSLRGVLIGGAAFALLRFGAVIRVLSTEFGHEPRPDPSLLRTQLAYAMPFQLAVLLEILQANLHQYAVSLHFDPATFAIYSVGCLQVPLVDLLAGTSCNVMMVKMGEDLRTGRGEAAVAAWHATVRKLALAFFPLVAILLVNARDLIVFLFTARYLGSVPIFMVWTASFLLMTLPVDGVLRVHADTRFLFLLGAVKLLIIGATVGWFLGRFQLLGGVFVSLLAVLVGKSLALFRVKLHLKVTWSGLMPWSSLAATLLSALAAALPALLVKDTLALPPVASMLVSGVVYLLAYAALAGGLTDSGLRRRLVSILEAQR
jgi:O-antigen/teichoic acid export membrane protein